MKTKPVTSAGNEAAMTDPVVHSVVAVDAHKELVVFCDMKLDSIFSLVLPLERRGKRVELFSEHCVLAGDSKWPELSPSRALQQVAEPIMREHCAHDLAIQRVIHPFKETWKQHIADVEEILFVFDSSDRNVVTQVEVYFVKY